jgi:ankyrin repeat protein
MLHVKPYFYQYVFSLTNGILIPVFQSLFFSSTAERAAQESTQSSSSSRIGQRRLRTETQAFSSNIQKLLETDGDKELVDVLMKYSKSPRGYSVLEEAVLQKDYRAVDILLTNGYQLNASQYLGRTAVTIAVLNDDEQMLDYLLKKGAIFSSENLGYIAHSDSQYDRTIQRLILLKNKGG